MEYVYAVEGRLAHHIYSPKGDVEGLLLMAGDIPVQFVVPPEHRADAAALRDGMTLEVEGVVPPPSHKGEAHHDLYELCGIAKIDGKPVEAAADAGQFKGTIARLNYAKHGEPNGYVLDNGDFVHTKPDGFKKLGLAVSEMLQGTGVASRLATGKGRVIEAEEINGRAVH